MLQSSRPLSFTRLYVHKSFLLVFWVKIPNKTTLPNTCIWGQTNLNYLFRIHCYSTGFFNVELIKFCELKKTEFPNSIEFGPCIFWPWGFYFTIFVGLQIIFISGNRDEIAQKANLCIRKDIFKKFLMKCLTI